MVTALCPMKRKHQLLALLALFSAMATSGCSYHNEEELYPMNFCDTSAVRYSTTIRPIIEANCAISGCHVPGGEGNGDYTTFSALQAKAISGVLLPSINQVGNAIAMPPNGKLSDCEITQITVWVQQGAPQN